MARYTSAMVNRSLFFVFVLSVSLAYGQLDSNSITVTANRNAAVQPDQVVFLVGVSAGLNTSLDDVLAAVAGAGITQANFSSVNPFPGVIPLNPITGTALPLLQNITWNFTLPVSLSKMKDTVATLTGLQKTITQNNSGLMLSFNVQGTQVSPQLLQMQTCSVADLLSDARTKAQQLANAADLFLGSVLAMSSVTTPVPLCSLTVKFAVTR